MNEQQQRFLEDSKTGIVDLVGWEDQQDRQAEEAEKKAQQAEREAKEAADRERDAKLAAIEAKYAELANRESANLTTESDTRNDKQEKSGRVKLPMTTEAADCARLYREAWAKGDKTSMKSIVEDYAKDHTVSVSYIRRVLNDNPDQWKRK